MSNESTGRELFVTWLSDVPPKPRLSDWGPWRLHDDYELATDPDLAAGYAYPVDMEECTHSAEVLDTICQVAEKTWADDETLAGLVRALNDVLRPQANLCSCGRDKRLSRGRIRQLVRKWLT